MIELNPIMLTCFLPSILVRCVAQLMIFLQSLLPCFYVSLLRVYILSFFTKVRIYCTDVDPDPVGSAFIWVPGSGSESRGIK